MPRLIWASTKIDECRHVVRLDRERLLEPSERFACPAGLAQSFAEIDEGTMIARLERQCRLERGDGILQSPGFE
jgi:hypothetical protein